MENSNRERRIQSAFERLGTNRPQCISCGDTNPMQLQVHHLAGRVYGDWTVILCRACHHWCEYMKKNHLPQIGDPPGHLESLAHLMLGIADLFPELVNELRLDRHMGYVNAAIQSTIVRSARRTAALSAKN